MSFITDFSLSGGRRSLLAVAALAALVPALRIVRLNPITALRS